MGVLSDFNEGDIVRIDGMLFQVYRFEMHGVRVIHDRTQQFMVMDYCTICHSLLSHINGFILYATIQTLS